MYSDVLQHYGTKGMKWGVRRNRNSSTGGSSQVDSKKLSKTKANVDNAQKVVNESKNINRSVGNIKSTRKSKNETLDLSTLSDKELRERVNRLNMEQQYMNLSSKSNTVKGRSYTSDMLEIGGSALAITSSVLGVALAIRELRG